MKNGKGIDVGLTESAIATICALTPGNYNNACNKGADAATTQLGVKQDDVKYEDKLQKMGLQESYDLIGQRNVYIIGGTAYIVNAISNKKVVFEIPNLGVCDSVHADLSPTSSTVNLKWTFK
jgi:hypothetical protein